MILTPRQQEILDVIRRLIETRGYSPSYREIGESAGLSSSASVCKHVRALIARKRISRGYGRVLTVLGENSAEYWRGFEAGRKSLQSEAVEWGKKFEASLIRREWKV